MSDADNFEKQEERVRNFLREQAKRAISIRSKDREFHGLEREFVYHQAQMIFDYERTRDMKHPRDLGDAREQILRKFISESGYIPKRYSVSSRSVRVASASGHISNEIDAAFYDPMESSVLMKREDVYEVHPVECVYGVIQIKSRLTKKELLSGLKNIESYKNLQRPIENTIGESRCSQKSESGFGVIFAYSSDMKWMDIVNELKKYAKNSSLKSFPNAVFVLDRGFFLWGDGTRAVFKNRDIEDLASPTVHGFPDRDGSCLFNLTSIMLSLLRTTEVKQAELANYYRLPLIAQDHSYSFAFGAMAEVGSCKEHGDFARKISSESLEKIVRWCQNSEPINWIRATNIAYGLPHDEEAYRRQPGDVHIYNPENLELNKILISDKTGGLAFDIIDADGMRIYLPFYYAAKEGLISGCPACLKTVSKRERRVPAKKPSDR